MKGSTGKMAVFPAGEVAATLDEALARRLSIRTAEVTGSTNDDIRVLAEKGKKEGAVMIAGEQTAGKGRHGHSFYSPKDSGLYMSILLRPSLPASQSLMITTAAAVAVSQAIGELTGTDPVIKWVNDIFIGGRKVCGILTEASLTAGGVMDHAVLGIGVNVAESAFPEDIRDTAGTLGADAGIRAKLAGLILTRFFRIYDDLPSNAYMEEYRRRSFLIGRNVAYERGSMRYTGRVAGIDDEARLIVERDGTVDILSSGEISVRPVK